MADLVEQIRRLILEGTVRISDHGYEALLSYDITVREVVSGGALMRAIEPYPDFPKGPCVLALQADRAGRPIHVVWGIPKGYNEPAVLVTAYRPIPMKWDPSFTRRKR
jgi:hypothetical protein